MKALRIPTSISESADRVPAPLPVAALAFLRIDREPDGTVVTAVLRITDIGGTCAGVARVESAVRTPTDPDCRVALRREPRSAGNNNILEGQ